MEQRKRKEDKPMLGDAPTRVTVKIVEIVDADKANTRIINTYWRHVATDAIAMDVCRSAFATNGNVQFCIIGADRTIERADV